MISAKRREKDLSSLSLARFSSEWKNKREIRQTRGAKTWFLSSRFGRRERRQRILWWSAASPLFQVAANALVTLLVLSACLPSSRGGKRGERRYLNELLRIVNKRAILTLVVMTFLPFPSSLSLVKKSIENFLSLRGEGKNETRRVQWIARREKEKEEDEEDGSVLFPYHPKKSGRSKAPPRLFVLQEIKYEAIKLPVKREPRRRLRRPLLFFCASNLGASRKGQIMASL